MVLFQSLAHIMIEIKAAKFKRKRSKERLQSSHIKETKHMVGHQEMYSEKSSPKGPRLTLNTQVLIESTKGTYIAQNKFKPPSKRNQVIYPRHKKRVWV